jgi:hypothetical protein
MGCPAQADRDRHWICAGRGNQWEATEPRMRETLHSERYRAWWCYRCGDTRSVGACPICGLKAPAAYDTQPPDRREDSDSSDDLRERTVRELDNANSTLKVILATLRSRSDASGFFWVLVFVFLLESWPGSGPDRWTDKAWYSVRYGAEFANITVEKRPLDCDFVHAPFGAKGCQYEKRTSVFGDEERQSLIRQATTTEEKQNFSKRPNAVTVYWEKKE